MICWRFVGSVAAQSWELRHTIENGADREPALIGRECSEAMGAGRGPILDAEALPGAGPMATVTLHSASGRPAAPSSCEPDARHAVLVEPISPELVLVCPELREAALRALLDRPWEAFLPAGSHAVPAVLDLAPPAVVSVSTPETVRTLQAVPPPLADAPRASAASDRARPVHEPPHPPERRWLRIATNLGVLTAVLVAVGSLGAWESGGERLLPRVTPPQPPSLGGAPPAYRSGAYLIGNRGWMQTGRRGRAITQVQLPVFCSGKQIGLGRIPVRPDGRFRFVGRARDPRFRITLVGRFVTVATARGSVVVRGPGCPSASTRFIARVS
jgi:hypothetical protein